MSAPKIPDGPEWEVVRDAFRGSNLNPDNPEHWPFLLKGYIEIVYRRARAGRQREGADERYIKMGAGFSQVQHPPPRKTDSDHFRLLAQQNDYHRPSPPTPPTKMQD